MFRSAGSSCICFFAAMLVGIATSFGFDVQTELHLGSRMASPHVAAAADGQDPERLAAALALDRIPAGFVLRAETLQPSPSRPPNEGSGVSMLVSQAIERFLAKRPDYTVTDDAGWALVFRPREPTSCDAALQRTLAGAGITAPAYEAFWRLAVLVNANGAPSAPPAVVCGGQCDPGEHPNHRSMVTLATTGLTVQDALSQVVNQAPGLVWLLRDESSPPTRPRSCRLTYFDGAHHVTTSYVLNSEPGAR